MIDNNCEELENKLKTILRKQESLRDFLIEPPYLFVLPCKEKGKYAAVVWLYLNTNLSLTCLLIHKITSMVLLALKKVFCESELLGIDVVPSIRMQNGETDRILRISVWRGFYDNWQKIKAKDIYIENPSEGITCGWYWDIEKVPYDEVLK